MQLKPASGFAPSAVARSVSSGVASGLVWVTLTGGITVLAVVAAAALVTRLPWLG